VENMKGQGATEYLVLLAVVLIVALVSVALLGFFPGMALDAQITQSQAYWKSASPISIIDGGAISSSGSTYMYLRIRNTGAYSIRLTGIIGSDGGAADQFYGIGCGISPAAYKNISDYFYLAPGEEKYFAWSGGFGTQCDYHLRAATTASVLNIAGGASSVCQNSTSSPGVLDFKSIGFQYIEYLDNNQISKKQIGRDFIVKCLPSAG